MKTDIDTFSGLEGSTQKIVSIFAKFLNTISGVWLFAVAALILFDVVGREAFSVPFHGTNEIVSNSVLSILFLQLPLSIMQRGSLRTTIFFDRASVRGKGVIDASSYILALILFAAIAFGSWPNMIEGWEILELEGSGVIEIPVYPIRTLVVVASILGIAVCGLLAWESLVRPEDVHDVGHKEIGE
ncbi:MAG: TRAP transporter small permease [Pseudomonadota bacterium]|nr:TRAP transporter small permease [Pseudomonadota bacterium]